MAGIDELVQVLIAAARLPEENTAASELRTAADALSTATAATIGNAATQWSGAVDGVAAAAGLTPGELVRRAWRLPDIPALGAFAAGLAGGALARDPQLLGGGALRAGVGPLELAALLPAVVARPSGAAPVLVGLLPPSGLDASLAAGPVTADGSVEVTDDAVTGALSASIGVVSAGALARLTTAGHPAFVAILGARFTPGIQVGFGFEISTLGGVVGVGVGTDTGALRRALASGNAVALFFPSAPADTAERTARLRLVGEVFSPSPGTVVAGPAAEVTWLQVGGFSLLRLSLVALLEIPRGRVVVLGRGAFSTPPMLAFRVDLLGEIDPRHGVVALDMALVEGRVLGLLRAAGTMALRVRTSEPTHALLTIGGFFPGFRVNVPGLPPQQRISMGPDLPLPLTFRFEGYLAVTDGTFQVGARIEIAFDLGLSVHGYLQFDAMAQFDPFRFHARLAGGVDVGALGIDFAGVDFGGTIDGPGPVVVAGRVSVSFMGATASWRDSFRIGEGSSPAPPPVRDLAGLVVEGRERTDLTHPLAVPPGRILPTEARDPHVIVEAPATDAAGHAVVPPLGAAVWSQTAAPLDHEIHLVGGKRLAAPATVRLANLPAGAEQGPTELFAPAALRVADKSELLALPAFERLPSGVAVTLRPADAGAPVPATLEYQEFYPGVGPAAGAISALSPGLLGLLADVLAPARVRDRPPRLVVHEDAWVVAGEGARTASSRTDAVATAHAARANGADAAAVPANTAILDVHDLWQAP